MDRLDAIKIFVRGGGERKFLSSRARTWRGAAVSKQVASLEAHLGAQKNHRWDRGASFNISSAISQSACAGLACAMGATIDGHALFYTMTKNPAPAMVAGWRDGLNCTFKTVKNMRPAGYC